MRNRTVAWGVLSLVIALALSGNSAIASDLAQPSQQDPCRRVGEGRFPSPDPTRCQGYWAIYASFSGGGTWWHDKDGTNPQARHIARRAALLQARLARCGIRSHLSLSDWFDRFTPGLAVVHSSPYATGAQADRELRLAQRCRIAGYAKFSELQIAGRD